MSIESMCQARVTIQRRVATADSAGGVVKTWFTHILNQRAKVDRQTPREGREYDREAVRDFRVVFMPDRVDVTESDRVLIDGNPYEVRGVAGSGAPGRSQSYTRADVERVR